MTRPLPYSQYKWSFSQHDVGLEPDVLYKLLKIAAAFEGDPEASGEKMTALMIQENVLTENKRNGKPDAWRDYQQILPELGLIYSTRLVRPIRLTPLGRLFLSGGIGFSELIGLQALRYQYPNGHKSQTSRDVRVSLGKAAKETLTESQAQLGILIKPAVLVLRVLLELLRVGAKPTLSLDECLAFLLPCRANSEWELAFNDVQKDRGRLEPTVGSNPDARRNMQDWFKFLFRSDLFTSAGKDSIGLTPHATNNALRLLEMCEELGRPEMFWIPTDFTGLGRAKWFDWFGSVNSTVFDLTRGSDVSEEYIGENYVEGPDDAEDEIESEEDARSINLSPVNIERLLDPLAVPLMGADSESAAAKMKQGVLKRHAKTVLHNQLVAELATALQNTGAKVHEDPNSVDILASWEGKLEAIFEVKTATRRTLPNRIRLAVGQVEEYAYRNKVGRGIAADKVIAVNASVSQTSWYRQFLVDNLGIGLVCITAGGRISYVPNHLPSRKLWHEKI